MITLIIINIFFIIYIYFKYYKKHSNHVQEYNDTIETDSLILGYVNDEGFNNNFDLLISEIIDLNIKGYLKIEYNDDNKDKYNYIIKKNEDINVESINDYEIVILNFLFLDKTEITKQELEYKFKNVFETYNVQYNELENILEEKLNKKNYINYTLKKEIGILSKTFTKLSNILTIIFTIIGIFNIFNVSDILHIKLVSMTIFILENTIISLMLRKVSLLSDEGNAFKMQIQEYRNNLENIEFLTGKATMQEIVLNKGFANSLALHIDTEAKRAFIDDQITKTASELSKKAATNVFTVSTAILIVGIFVYIISKLLNTSALFWIYFIFALISAVVIESTTNRKI